MKRPDSDREHSWAIPVIAIVSVAVIVGAVIATILVGGRFF